MRAWPPREQSDDADLVASVLGDASPGSFRLSDCAGIAPRLGKDALATQTGHR